MPRVNDSRAVCSRKSSGTSVSQQDAIGANFVSGTDDDRFDVDALVDMTVPWQWSDDQVLDKLEEALKGFPAEIVYIA